MQTADVDEIIISYQNVVRNYNFKEYNILKYNIISYQNVVRNYN